MTGSAVAALALVAPLTVGLAVATTTGGCVTSCSAVGVMPGFHIAVDAPDGEYTVVVDADGDELLLELALADGRVTCPGEGCGALGSAIELHVTSDGGDGFHVRVARLDAWLGPDQVALEVFRGAESVFADTLVADYGPSYPNGESCGSAGEIAEAAIDVR